MMIALYAEMADVGLGMVLLLLGVVVLKDQVQRGRMIVAYLVLQTSWAAGMLLYNLWTLDGWVLLVDVLWFAVLVAGCKLTQICWRFQKREIRKRDAERLARILGTHERID